MSSSCVMESAKELCYGDVIPVYQLEMPCGSHMLKVMMPDGYPLMFETGEAMPGVETLQVAYDQRGDVSSRSLGRVEALGQQLRGHVIQTDQHYCFYLNSREGLSVDVVAVHELGDESDTGRFEVYPVIDSLDLETIQVERDQHMTDDGLEEVIAETRAVVQLSMRAAIRDEITDLGHLLNRCTLMLDDYQNLADARDLQTAQALATEEDYLTRCQLARRYDQGYQFSREIIEASRGIRQLDAKLLSIVNRL